jgi:hypothetical protein
MVALASLPGLFVLRDDAKFLRHVKWSLAASNRMEQRWTSAVHAFLDLVSYRACLSKFLNAWRPRTTGVMVKMRRLRFTPLLTITLVLLVMSCCTMRESSLFRLVPKESCAIMSIEWSSIRDDRELRRLIKADQFEALLRMLGVDSEAVNSVVVFSAVDNQAMSGLLLRGSFDSKKVGGELKQGGWTQNLVEGHKIYVKAADYVAMPATKTLFAGTREGALAVFRAVDSGEESIVASDTYKKIDVAISKNRTPVKAFLLIPQGTLDMADAALTTTSVALSLFNLGGIGQLLQAVNVARGFGFSLDRGTGEMYPVELCVLMRDEQSAAFVNGSLNALKTISELAATDNRDRESLRAIRQMSIVRKQEVLAVKMEIPGTALFPPARTNTGLNN